MLCFLLAIRLAVWHLERTFPPTCEVDFVDTEALTGKHDGTLLAIGHFIISF